MWICAGLTWGHALTSIADSLPDRKSGHLPAAFIADRMCTAYAACRSNCRRKVARSENVHVPFSVVEAVSVAAIPGCSDLDLANDMGLEDLNQNDNDDAFERSTPQRIPNTGPV